MLTFIQSYAQVVSVESPQLDKLTMQTLVHGEASRDRDLLSGKVLKQNVPDDSLKSFKAFQKFYDGKKSLSYTKKQRFLSSAMVRLKILIKAESTDASGNVTLKPDKSINPTAIVRNTKSGGKPDKQKILGKLMNGVRTLIALRNSIEV